MLHQITIGQQNQTLSAEMSLADILRTAPAAVSVLHKHNLDFCCGGKESLADACAVKQLNTPAILEELEAIAIKQAGSSNHMELWDTQLLIDYTIQNHHRYLRNTLPMATEQMTQVVTKHGAKYPDSPAILELLADLSRLILVHLDEEESGVFKPSAVNDAPEQFLSEIAHHESEHEDVGSKLQRLRAITNDFTPPPDACTTHRAAYDTMRRLREDTMQHIFIENMILFPRLLKNEQTPFIPNTN